jgi:hypothetical protein
MAETFLPSNLPHTAPVIPVSLLNRLARERLEAAFPLCWVAGEVSNLSRASSGHVYFSLKDSAAQVRCVMFRSRAQLLGWRLENGQHIEARVLVTLYEARGDFQLNVEAARRGGVGNLYEQFLRLKEKLAARRALRQRRQTPPARVPTLCRHRHLAAGGGAARRADDARDAAPAGRHRPLPDAGAGRRAPARRSPTPFAVPASAATAKC